MDGERAVLEAALSGTPGEAPDGRPLLGDREALAALAWCFGWFYELWTDGPGMWLARRHDGQGVIEGGGPDELLKEIHEDLLLRPVQP
ncbi:MAG TPA: hypothetical protein VKU77_36990 [Streptosporangiaceae bacterium]|nr:hypothetical protein [Streptosporangiaceae bacterium]